MSESKPQRVTWVDLARGIGILLVVIGHASGGVIDSPLGAQAPELRIVFLTIYTFHMPLFFVLSGLFVADRLKADARKFIANTFTKIARAYFTWAIIQFTIIYMMGNALNHPASGAYLPQVVAIIWTPVSQFWFLFALFFMQIAAWMIVPRLGAVTFMIAVTALWIAYNVMGLPPVLNYAPVNQFCTFAISFGLGVVIGPHLAKIKILQAGKPVYALVALIAWLALYFGGYMVASQILEADWLFKFQGAEIAYTVNGWMFYPAALAGTAMVILICCANLIPARKFFEYMGRSSMPIFLTHILFIAGSRIILLKFYPAINVYVLLGVITVIGIVGSLAFFEIMKKLRLAKPFAMV